MFATCDCRSEAPKHSSPRTFLEEGYNDAVLITSIDLRFQGLGVSQTGKDRYESNNCAENTLAVTSSASSLKS